MGCDVHMYVEIKTEHGWELYCACDAPRNYWFFGILAGVRSYEEPIVDPKGFPEDASYIVRKAFESMGPDAHTPSWFDISEIDTLGKWCFTQGERAWMFTLESDYLHCWIEGHGLSASEEWPEWIHDVRLVFWFDN